MRGIVGLLGIIGRGRVGGEVVDPAPQRGQVLPMFIFLSVVLLGGAALVTDVAWLWMNQQRMQRAADAGALAGAIYLPGDEARAFSTARAEASKNGYTSGLRGVVVTPRRALGDPRKLLVDIDGPVGTFFARAIGFGSFDTGVTGLASYVLPVPMGSPQNYYGVGYLVDAVVRTTTNRVDTDSGWRSETDFLAGDWTGPGNARTNNDSYATEDTDGQRQMWRAFGLQTGIVNDPSTVIDGLQVRLTDVSIQASAATDCRLDAEVSWDSGGSWSSTVRTGPLGTSSTADQSLGSDTSTAAWGGHAWTYADLSDGTFRVRLTWRDGTADCPATRSVRLDQLEVRVDYHYDQATTTTTFEPVDVTSPTGAVLAPQNFWGALQSQGAPNIQGDAYMTYYDTRTSASNDDYRPTDYYQYAVEFPAGSTNGEIWLFDPGFCDVSTAYGTGEYWTVGGANGYSSRRPISTFYDLYDTGNTPYDTSDDALVQTSGSRFRSLLLSDHVFGRTMEADCSGQAWHNGWWELARGLSGGRTYRLHTYSTDPSSSTDQRDSTALNGFAIWSSASGGTPRVHGLGAMEAYVRLPGGRSSEFYLAQIDREHAGKTMVIRLWDPGDTGSLAADLQVLGPSASAYTVWPFSYTAERNSGAASSCAGRSGQNVTSVTTNTGGTSLFNGCWLNIEIPLPNDYTAPHPSSDSVTGDGGWWKIRYNMSGSASSNSTDMTTWEVALRGSPVHLVLE